MAGVLILYGTTDGHTRKIADAMSRTFRAEGLNVDVMDARGVPAQISPRGYAAVVVAASVHAGGYQRAAKRWVRRHVRELNDLPTAFVSVCLGILEGRPEARRAVQEIMRTFLMRSGWQPTVSRTVAGALPWTRYGWLKKRVMLRIVKRAGGDTDTSRDFEYTDWEEVASLAREVAAQVKPPSRARPAPVMAGVSGS